MVLESLANETLYEIFKYLDAVELLRAFHNLNGRFNAILFVYFHTYRVNFHFVLKYWSDIVYAEYFPLIIDRIISLRLSDNDDESGSQTDRFFSSGLLFNQFIRLRSLSLCYIDCEMTLRKLMVDSHQLPHLTHLKVVKCHARYMSSDDFSNTIWSLPKLTHCRLDMQANLVKPTMISSTLEYLSISCRSFGLTQMIDLSQQTPTLGYLHAPLNNLNKEPYPTLSSLLSITMLKLSNVRSSDLMADTLQATPNLTHLKVDTMHIKWDGYRWEELIDNYLPKLKTFRFMMYIQLFGEKNSKKYVEELFNSFRTPFWLEKHQWYIRCGSRSQNNVMNIILHTIHYGFVDIHSSMLAMSNKTSCSRCCNHGLYAQVKNFRYNFSISYLPSIQLSNIRNLSINLYFNVNIWKNVPTFYRLISVTVLATDDNAQFHLQSLLDRAPCLYSLTIKSWPSSHISLVDNTSASLRRLDLRLDHPQGNNSFSNNEACETFIRSSLGMQCEELLIKVNNHENMLAFVTGMPNLRMLQIYYHLQWTSFFDYMRIEKEGEELIQWLHDSLPSTRFTACNNNNRRYKDFLKLWIHLEKQ